VPATMTVYSPFTSPGGNRPVGPHGSAQVFVHLVSSFARTTSLSGAISLTSFIVTVSLRGDSKKQRGSGWTATLQGSFFSFLFLAAGTVEKNLSGDRPEMERAAMIAEGPGKALTSIPNSWQLRTIALPGRNTRVPLLKSAHTACLS